MPKLKTFLPLPLDLTAESIDRVFNEPSQFGLLQKALGKRISKTAWAKIGIVIGLYIAAVDTEERSPTTDEFVDKLSKLLSALRLVKEMTSALPLPTCGASIPSENLQRMIEEQYFQMKPAVYTSADQVMLPMFEHAVNALALITDWCMREASKSDYSGMLQSSSWSFLILFLTSVLYEHDLPFKVSKSTRISDNVASPFVDFIWELQSQLPQKYRRHRHSKSALAQAIVRARKGFSPESIRFSSLLAQFAPATAAKLTAGSKGPFESSRA